MARSIRSLSVLLTASEAYPALERAFLMARSEIWASFLVFDLSTRLRSPEALQIGKTWFDLVVHTLNRGVSINICISDVDPIARAQLHRQATRSMRMFSAAAAVANPGVRLKVECARHPAATGALLRALIWPYIMKKLKGTARWLNGLSAEHRAAALRDMNRAMDNFRLLPDGRVGVRYASLPKLYPAVHHQKMAVIDRKAVYLGGLDLDERRFDTPNHRRAGDETWHDVQVMIEGPIATEAQLHLETFRAVTAGQAEPPRTRRLLRTMSRPNRTFWNFGPQPVISELRNAHFVLAGRAESLIYLETQYFRDIGLARELAIQARNKPGLQLILILPAAPDDVAFDRKRGLDARFGEAMQAQALRILRKAFGARIFVGSPAQPRPALPDGNGATEERRDRLHNAPLVYVHSKVSVFDDLYAVISSANLNGRSLRWDTETGVYINMRDDVVDLRYRVMAHWLPKDPSPAAFEPATAVDYWVRMAWRNASRKPTEREGYMLPHDFAAAEAFGTKVPLLPREFV